MEHLTRAAANSHFSGFQYLERQNRGIEQIAYIIFGFRIIGIEPRRHHHTRNLNAQQGRWILSDDPGYGKRLRHLRVQLDKFRFSVVDTVLKR